MTRKLENSSPELFNIYSNDNIRLDSRLKHSGMTYKEKFSSRL